MTIMCRGLSMLAGCILMLAIFACAVHVKIDDRLSYVVTKKFQGRYMCQRNPHFVLNETSKKLVVAQHPDGFVGSGVEYHLAIGETFWAYLDQASQTAFRSSNPSPKDPVYVKVKILEYDLAFTISASGVLSGIRAIDWVKLSLTLETKLPRGITRMISIQKEVDLSPGEIQGISVQSQAVSMALEGLVLDFLDKATSSIEILDC